MTRIFIRALRGGDWKAVEFESLTQRERSEYFEKIAPEHRVAAALRMMDALSDAVTTLERERGRPSEARR